MLIVMANFGAPTGGWHSAGQSAVWSSSGSLLAMADSSGDQLIVAAKNDGEWSAKVVNV